MSPSRWCLLVVLCAGLSAAAEAPAATPLPPVQVPAPPLEGVEARAPASAVTVVELDGPATARDAAEALKAVPSAVIEDVGGVGQRKLLSLRGAAPNATLVLLDGVPLAAPGEATDLSRIPAAALSRLEVLRGAGSRYGAGAMGGVVNLVTRAPDGTRAFGEGTFGSFLTGRGVLGASVGLPVGDLLVLAHGLTSDGTFDYRYQPLAVSGGEASLVTRRRDNNWAQQGGALARLRSTLGDTTLDVLAEGLLERRGLAGPVQNPSPGASQQSARGTLSLHTSTPLPGGATLAGLAWGRLDDLTLVATPAGAGAVFQRQVSAGAEAVYTRQLGRHALTALVTGGGDWLFGPATPIGWGRVGAMAADEVSLWEGRVTVDASARVDLTGPFAVVSPQLGATAQLPHGLELRLAGGLASRAPSFAELYLQQGTLVPNPGLRPERGLGLDATAAWSRGGLRLSATGFLTWYQDLISYEYYPPNLARPYNFEAARAAGLELEGHARPLPWVDLSATYTFTSTANLAADPRYLGKPLPLRPEHQLHARATVGNARLKGVAELAYQSAMTFNRTATFGVPERALLNLGLSCVPSDQADLTVAFDVKNLLDVQSQDVDGYPLPPRSLFLTLALAWDGAKHP